MRSGPSAESEVERTPAPPPGPGIGAQAVRGSFVSIGASTITLTLGFARSVLLARLLLPEHFGLVALALFYIGLVSRLRGLGFDMALIHRQDADEAFLRTYFTARMGVDIVAFGALLLASPLIQFMYPNVPGLGAVLPWLILAYFLSNLSQVQETLLRKNLAFSSLAATDVVASVVMTGVAPYLAWTGWGVWALVAEQVSGLGTRFVLTWGPFRQWWPRPGWDREKGRWLWNFGKATWVVTNLSYLTDKFDDFWTGTALGQIPLGYYSRAYDYARYPRRVFANPLVSVFTPIFARLQGNRTRLSQAFYRSAHLIIRTGFLVAGVSALVMPEFIQFVIGDKWQPMLWTFRLMLVYIMLDPVLMLAGNLVMAVGQPRRLQKVQWVQTGFFIPAVVLGASLWGINGVALAANGMLLVGAWWLYRPARQIVDFSLTRLALWPGVALVLAWGAGFGVERSFAAPSWEALLVKLAAFLALFGGFLLLVERGDYLRGLRWVWQAWQARGQVRS
ncbi:MAG: lipopolysaccharide biosynthesis protein [Anaerolineae bacterium]